MDLLYAFLLGLIIVVLLIVGLITTIIHLAPYAPYFTAIIGIGLIIYFYFKFKKKG